MAAPTGTVTFLFTDIEGSSKLWERNPEAMKAALARHDALLHETLQKDGYVFKTVGDAFCAAFHTAPEAAQAALNAQIALVQEPWPEAAPIKVRMALHTGAAESRDDDYFGQPLNRTARLLGVGHGGQVLLSDVAQDLVRDALPKGASLRPLGEHRLKDLGRPESVYQLEHPALTLEFPALKSLASLPNNLPQQLTSFIGREKAIADVKGMMEKTRLLTLTGAGGSGKTRLALQVAAEMLDGSGDGVWFVDLAALRDPSLVVATVAEVFELQDEQGKPIRQVLLDHLKDKYLLLVLDNCEHLLDACADLADVVLRHCPKVLILASSREALGIAGETTYRVPSLSAPDPKQEHTPESLGQFEAVRLFIERAEQVQTGFKVTNDSAPALASVCARLDGIPLAIELAAARVRTMSVQEVNQRLDQRFRLLTGGSRTALPRQQTLRSLIDWSYDLLNEAEQAMLRRLSVFAGGWDLESVEKVCAIPPIEDFEVLDLLAGLVDKSLAVAESSEAQTRYRLLETVRQYARDRLAESDEGQAVRDRHRDRFLDLVETAEPHLLEADQLAWSDKLAAENDNIRAALDWCEEGSEDGTPGLRFVGALWRFWEGRGDFVEGRERAHAALQHPGAQGRTLARARALAAAGALTWGQGEPGPARILHEEALAMFTELDNKVGISRCLNNLGVVSLIQMDLETAEGYVEQSRALNLESGDVIGANISLFNLGTIAKLQGNYPLARARLEQALKVSRELGVVTGQAHILSFLGSVILAQEGPKAAMPVLEESLALGTQSAYVPAISFSSWRLGVLLAQEGDLSGARAHMERALPLAKKMGLSQIGACLIGFGVLARQSGDAKRAVTLWAAGAALRDQAGTPFPQDERPAHEARLKEARGVLGDAAFEAAWAAGSAMTRDEAIAYALEDPGARPSA